MDKYHLLRFAHLVGLMLISAGLIGVFAADMRSRQVRDMQLFAQAVSFIAVFYDGLVVPGAILLLVSGTWLIVEYYGGWEFIATPWLAGMVLLFAFELIEGNTITRLYFMRLRQLTRVAVAEGRVTAELGWSDANLRFPYLALCVIPSILSRYSKTGPSATPKHDLGEPCRLPTAAEPPCADAAVMESASER